MLGIWRDNTEITEQIEEEYPVRETEKEILCIVSSTLLDYVLSFYLNYSSNGLEHCNLCEINLKFPK